MSFEEILPKLKQGAKIIRAGWSGFELYVTLVEDEVFDGSPVTPYFLIKQQMKVFQVSPQLCVIF